MNRTDRSESDLMLKINLGGSTISESHEPLLVPDIGTFFNQDTSKAVDLIAQLHSAGAQVVKGEILHNADICLDGALIEKYFSIARGKVVGERYRDLIERKVVSLDKYERIFSECKRRGLPFLTSVYDFVGADFSLSVGACALKIATSNIVHEPLIRYVAGLGLPMIIDTGKSSMAEIARAMEWARQSGASDIILEYSPLPPPAPVQQQNIRAITLYRNAFNNALVGLSDHHAGPEMLYAAVVLGACVLEKGVRPDDLDDDQDVGHALPISQFAEVKRICQSIWNGLGRPQLLPVESPKMARMGIVAGRDLKAGEVLSPDTTSFAFPAVGVPVEHWSLVQGWRMKRDLDARTPIKWTDLLPE
jgi:sialic acid synthase SpsE